ncbi:hypothetical protein [Fuscibacter oryzae]|uniref:Uncharacterized protein n=1 Tax=Fuscibacter oryzae TaxID=2803939 RepID=A0A8J7MXT2_9RHOB|nr:hypothetical protein [Fuscibacter oryzae]MBL4929354.1 hypothetical protein [Fuscibacter oryzae]
MPEYRVKQARVEVCNGFTSHYENLWIAQRRVTLFGISLWWWPVLNARWSRTKAEARLDAVRDADMRAEDAQPETFFLPGNR